MSHLPDRLPESEVSVTEEPGKDDIKISRKSLFQKGRARFINSGVGRVFASLIVAAGALTGALLADNPQRASSAGPQEVAAESGLTPWDAAKYQTFPRIVLDVDARGSIRLGLQLIDLGTLGPDVDTIAAADFRGDIPTNALVVGRPPAGMPVEETRVVFIKRTDIETVQLQPALGGDRFEIYQISRFGGDPVLDAGARGHARNTARAHQKTVYIGDLGLFERQWGDVEQTLLHSIIRAQRPGRVSGGKIEFPEPNFVFPR